MKKLREKKGAWGSGETKGGKSEVSNGWFKFRRDKEQGENFIDMFLSLNSTKQPKETFGLL